MTFREREENRALADHLTEVIRRGSLHHAYVLEGPATVDKLRFAKDLVQAILCPVMPGIGCGECAVCRKVEGENHVDLTILRPRAAAGGKTESVRDEDIRHLQSRLRSKPYDGDRNMAIIAGCDTVTLRAFNRLLKTLEEPPEGTVILLLADNARALPQTILSRAVHLRLLAGEDGGHLPEADRGAELKGLLDEGAEYYKLRRLIESVMQKKDGGSRAAGAMLDRMEELYRDELYGQVDRMHKEWIYHAIAAIETAREQINGTINGTYALKNMVLTIAGGESVWTS